MSLQEVLKRITHESDAFPVPSGPLREFTLAARKIQNDKAALQFLFDHTLNEEHYDFLIDLVEAAAMIETILIDKTPTDKPKESSPKEPPTDATIEKTDPEKTVTCPQCGGRAVHKGTIEMPGYLIKEFKCDNCGYPFEKLTYDLIRKDTLKTGSLKGGPSEPFTKDPPGEGGRFEGCVQELMNKGKTKESATNICAAIMRAKFGKKGV